MLDTQCIKVEHIIILFHLQDFSCPFFSVRNRQCYGTAINLRQSSVSRMPVVCKFIGKIGEEKEKAQK